MGKSTFSKEQREKIAQEAIETGNQKAVAEKYGIKPTSLYGWVKAFRTKGVQQKNKSAKAYEKEVEDLKLEVKILKELLKITTQTLIKD